MAQGKKADTTRQRKEKMTNSFWYVARQENSWISFSCGKEGIALFDKRTYYTIYIIIKNNDLFMHKGRSNRFASNS